MTADERAAAFRSRMRRCAVDPDPEPPLTTVDAARLGALRLWVGVGTVLACVAAACVVVREVLP